MVRSQKCGGGDKRDYRREKRFFVSFYLSKAIDFLQTAWSQVQRSYHVADRATGGLLKRLARAWNNFNQYDTRQAASISYYGLFSLFPLLLLAVTVISALVGPAIAEERILEIAGTFLPGETLGLITENVQLALEQQQSVGLIAGIGLVWSALSLFSNLSFAIDTIFHPTRPRPMWRQRFLAIGMTVILALLLLVSIIATATFRLISILLLDRPSAFLTIGSVFLPLGLNVAVFALLYRWLPRMHVRWDAVFPAALLGGLGWEFLKNIFVWFLENLANFSVIYGSLGTVIVLMIWTYLTACMVLLGAEFCAVINEWLNERNASRRAIQPVADP